MYIIFFLRNRGSEKEQAEDMLISEVRKCSRLLTVNSLIDQLHHRVVGTIPYSM